ncbi:restriction endonuclease subunit S [Vagococcus fluvialis]|uniref:restriction endonuclease subunit S n=1 Tax=Vagococcus fluvialis TaxID=2738 RepID=UPI001D0AB8B7|nr:restriction endonuclease subunit S [Vagococcus fluvialis]UDM70465.1 restriction endonuclease subunit S [Vagococcus fluvialis]UDM77883.1 restriction endonuclease subunit S [Vagococcus fluvialis]UDM82152.1 restriction endonuclease subunit S [Vagococcus fluvialis]
MKYKLSEISKYVTDKIDVESISISQYISTENMLEGKKGITTIEKLPNVKRVTAFKKKDILISNIRPYFKKIWFAEFDGGCSSDVLVFRASDVVTSEFLFTLLLQDTFFDQMVLSSKGTKMPRGDKKAIMNLEFYIPNLIIQNKISQILFNIKEKIELNNQIIDTLEEMASTLFKRWFVDFEFPDENGNPYKSSGGKMIDSELGEIPEEWEVTTLKNFSVNMKSGGTPSRKIEEYWEEGTIPWIKTKEINNNYIISSEEKITNLGLVNSSAKMIKPNSILIAMYGTTAGQLGFLTFPSSTNQACCSVESDFPMYTFLLLKNKQEYIKSLATGSAQQNLSKKILEEIKIVVAENELLIKFEDKCNFTKYINSLSLENEKIENIKNSLIPKLLSGEIGV